MAGFTTLEDTYRPLPILTVSGELPTGDALDRLRQAKLATGYSGRVLPVRAAQGSPGPILTVGRDPDWLVKFARVPDFNSVERLTAALTAILIDNDDPRLGGTLYLMNKWSRGQLVYKGEEPYDG